MKKLYRTKIDWWIWAFVLFTVVVTIIIAIGMPWWFSLLYGVLILSALFVGMFGVWYVIDGSDLVVYQFFRPSRFPIGKIKNVKLCKGYLSYPALSSKRVSIRFSDRKIMKSAMPLEISPENRELFIVDLLLVNPSIEVTEPLSAD